MPLQNKFLRYSPEITLEIFTLVYNKLIENGINPSHKESITTKYDNFSGTENYLQLDGNGDYFECYEEDYGLIETTVQEILGYDPFVKDEFVLPEKWCIKIQTNGFPKEVAQWRKSSWSNPGYMFYNGMWDDDNRIGHEEITFDQFKKYVLKEDFDWDLYETKSEPKQSLKQAVHCKTQEEWDFVKVKAGKLNAIKISNYCKSSCCLNLEDKTRATIDYYSGKGYQILSFQEWCDLNGYKMETEVKFEVGKWYKYSDAVYLKFNNLEPDYFICSERIVDGIHSIKKSNYRTSQISECSIEEIQQYLPDNHPDKITPAIQQVRDMQSGFKVGNWVIVLKESPGRNGKLNQLYKITGLYGNHITYSPRENIDIDKVKVRHATPEEINNHLISIKKIPAGEPLNNGIEPNKDGMFKYKQTIPGASWSGGTIDNHLDVIIQPKTQSEIEFNYLPEPK